MAKFTIFKGKDGKYYFNLMAAGDSEPVLIYSEGYSFRSSCENGVSSVKQNAIYSSHYEKKIALNGQYYFVLKGASWGIIARSETYELVSSLEHVIEAVKKQARNASIEDI